MRPLVPPHFIMSRSRIRSCLIVMLGSIASSYGQTVIGLSGSDWTLSNPDLNISVPAMLPSQAHLDLYNAQVIGNPYYGLNDFNLRWVAETNWTYTSAPIAGLNDTAASTWLLFNGLDTFTSIYVCDQYIASTNNQFRQYFFDVSSVLSSCSGDPVLSINFGSAPNLVDAIANEPGQETWPYGVELVYEFPNRQFMRKEQSDFGWDWGKLPKHERGSRADQLQRSCVRARRPVAASLCRPAVLGSGIRTELGRGHLSPGTAQQSAA